MEKIKLSSLKNINAFFNMRLIGVCIILFSFISIMGNLYWLSDMNLSDNYIWIAIAILIVSIINGGLALVNDSINRLIHILLTTFILILGISYIYKVWEIFFVLQSFDSSNFYIETLFIGVIIIFNLILIFSRRSKNDILSDVNKGCLFAFAISYFNDLILTKIEGSFASYNIAFIFIGIIISVVFYFYIKDEVDEVPMILLLIPGSLLNAQPVGMYYGIISVLLTMIFGKYVLAVGLYLILMYLSNKDFTVFMKRKKLTYSVIFLAVFSIVICTFPLKTKINKEINCIEWKTDDEDYLENVTVKVKGVLKSYLLYGNIFRGNILIDKYDFTYNSKEVDLYLQDNNDYLAYDLDPRGRKSLGWIYEEDYLGKLVIELFDEKGEWPKDGRTVISGPAKDKDEAVKISKEIIRDIPWALDYGKYLSQ